MADDLDLYKILVRIRMCVPKTGYALGIFFQHIKRVLDSPNFAQSLDNDDSRIGHMFVVGGFAESAILQESLRSEFGYKMNVIIPQVRTISKNFH